MLELFVPIAKFDICWVEKKGVSIAILKNNSKGLRLIISNKLFLN